MLSQNEIQMMTKYAWSLVGTPYKMGGNVPQDGGMDCSAVCLELMRSISKWGTDDANCQMIWYKWGPLFGQGTSKVREGDFLLFGKSHSELTHIAYAIDETYMIEAGGTDKTGMVRPRKQTWRKDLVAVIRL
jgi:cell wall-associated NlpC family hydrolase